MIGAATKLKQETHLIIDHDDELKISAEIANIRNHVDENTFDVNYESGFQIGWQPYLAAIAAGINGNYP